MVSIIAKHKLHRRAVLAGAASALALGALPLNAASAFAQRVGVGAKSRHGSANLGHFLCDSVHDKIAAKLDDVINDPAVDGERTALALMEARCPGCGERVHPATSSISAVIPQWQSPLDKNTVNQSVGGTFA